MDIPRAGTSSATTSTGFEVRPVLDDQWEIVTWLWQAYRHDLATIVNGLPYADGRYQAQELERLPSSDAAGYLAWRPHPNTGQDAPIGFAVVSGLERDHRTVVGFWVTPVIRREGVGRALALEVLSRHPGPWEIAFQHHNDGAAAFWRGVADTAFGPAPWAEEERPVPGRPDVPADHWITSR